MTRKLTTFSVPYFSTSIDSESFKNPPRRTENTAGTEEDVTSARCYYC